MKSMSQNSIILSGPRSLDFFMTGIASKRAWQFYVNDCQSRASSFMYTMESLGVVWKSPLELLCSFLLNGSGEMGVSFASFTQMVKDNVWEMVGKFGYKLERQEEHDTSARTIAVSKGKVMVTVLMPGTAAARAYTIPGTMRRGEIQLSITNRANALNMTFLPRVSLRSPPPSYGAWPTELCLMDQFHVEVREDNVVLGPILTTAVTGVYNKLGGWAAFELTHAAMTMSRNLYEKAHPPTFEAALRTALGAVLAAIRKQVETGDPSTCDNRRLASLIGERVYFSGNVQEEGVLLTFWQDKDDYVIALERPRLLRILAAELYSGAFKVGSDGFHGAGEGSLQRKQ
ncbi:hypothetical protein PMIN01_13423 [Paraphaeosphaeria minitans]|uniref:Uncharacterized protein n=1 Tax=Paraphaeosphaeria minitans TaxID=565426 RepID=A0A9P6G544_9PLEO|nr:hypothetical protein PMIN01_13423 [Paraphaeosphaeria minitans]